MCPLRFDRSNTLVCCEKAKAGEQKSRGIITLPSLVGLGSSKSVMRERRQGTVLRLGLGRLGERSELLRLRGWGS